MLIREHWVTEFWARLVANENDYGYFSKQTIGDDTTTNTKEPPK